MTSKLSDGLVVLVAPTIYALGKLGYAGIERLVVLFLRGLLKHAEQNLHGPGSWEVGCLCTNGSVLPRGATQYTAGPPLPDFREPNLLPAVARMLSEPTCWLDFSHSKPVGRANENVPHLSPIWHDPAIMQPPAPSKNVVALSEWQAERFRRIQNQECRVLDPICGDPDYFLPGEKPRGDYLLFIGKLSPDKGCLEAIQACRALKQRLEIVGPVTPGDPPGYVAEVLSQCDGQDIVYHGEVTEAHKLALLQRAKALLYTVSYPPGKGESHSHKSVEAMLAACPVILYDQGCYTADVRVVTPGGIRDYTDCHPGDLVWSLNTETGFMEAKQIEQVYEYDYDGPIIHFQNRRFDFRVTRNHRVLIKHWYQNPSRDGQQWPPSKMKFEYQEAGSLVGFGGKKCLPLSADWEGEDTGIAIPGVPYPNMNKLPSPDLLDWGDLLELWGWYISDGCIRHEHGCKDACNIFISEPEGNPHRADLESLLVKMGIKFGKGRRDGLSFHYYQLAALFASSGTEAKIKRIPQILLRVKPPLLARLFRGLMFGDGHESKRAGCVYTTASRELAENVVEICLKLGYECHIGSRLRPGHTMKDGRAMPTTTAFEVRIRKHIGVNGQLQREYVKEEPYSGKVWCFKVRHNNNMLIESCGDFVFCGNSMREIVDEGVTGLVISGRGELAEAIKACETMDRAACRARAIERWDYRKVVARWLPVMEEVSRGARW